MSCERLQVVFLVDTKMPDSRFEQHYRSLCLACTRILLFLSQFPNKEHLSRLKWNYKLFSSGNSINSIQMKTSQFYETRSEVLEKFFNDLSVSMKGECNTNVNLPEQEKQDWARSLYNALALTVQDFTWDAPEIATPVRHRTQRRKTMSRKKSYKNYTLNGTIPAPYKNMIFLFTGHSGYESDLRVSAERKRSTEGTSSNISLLIGRILPRALLTHLHDKHVSVNWVYTGFMKNPNLDVISKALGFTGGTLIPISVLLNPICQDTFRDLSIPSCPKQVRSNGISRIDEVTGDERSIQNSVEDRQGSKVPLFKSSAVRTSMKSYKDVIPTLVLPSMAILKDFLNPVSKEIQQLKDNMFFWLTSKEGKIICILELGKMYNCQKQTSKSFTLTKSQDDVIKENPHLNGVLTTKSNPYSESVNKGNEEETVEESLDSSQHKFHCSNNQESASQHSPQVITLGLIKQSAVPLKWLDLGSVCTCSGYCVPSSIRGTNMLTRILSEPPREPVTPQSVPFPQECLTFHKSPQIHLFRSPVSHRPGRGTPESRSHASLRPRRVTPESKSPASHRPRRVTPESRSPVSHRPRRFIPEKAHKRNSVFQSEHKQRATSVPAPTKRTKYKPCKLKDFSIVLKRNMVRSMSTSPAKIAVRQCSSERHASQGYDSFKSSQAGVTYLDPYRILRESERYHRSKQYQDLCIWLADNRLLMLVKVLAQQDSEHLALLQPITSLVSTLTFVKPCYCDNLRTLLANPPQPARLVSSSSPNLLNRNEKCCLSGISTLDNSIPTKVIGDTMSSTLTSTLSSTLSSNETLSHQDNFISDYASDPELLANIQLLLRPCSKFLSPSTGNSGLLSALLGSFEGLPSFTCVSLLPWFPYTQASGVKSSVLEKVQELLLDCNENVYDQLKSRNKLISTLKDLYTNSTPCTDVGDNTLIRDDSKEEEECIKEVEGEICPAVDNVLPIGLSEDELFDLFRVAYEEQLSEPVEDVNMDALYRWVSRELPQLLSHLLDNLPGNKYSLLQFWDQLVLRILFSSAQLAEKHGKVNEYLLQVLLNFEGLKLCCDVVEADAVSSTANRVVGLLRKVSLLNNPKLLWSFLQKLILPMYISSSKDLLIKVYEGLMLPLPSDIKECSPDLPTGSSAGEEEDGETSELELMSLEEPLPPKVAEPKMRKLIRCTSFQDSLHRQIMVPGKKRKKKEQKMKHAAADEKMHLRRLKKMVRSTAKRNSVCRSLFYHSGAETTTEKKKRGFGVAGVNILVKETPVKKQVDDYHKFKQERLRSKSSLKCSPGVKIVEESPLKSVGYKLTPQFPSGSFYSSQQRHKITPQFKTPPLNDGSTLTPPLKGSFVAKNVSPGLPLYKDPSPATIQSLLHDKFTTPSSGTPTSLLSVSHRTPQRHVGVTPDLFEFRDNVVSFPSGALPDVAIGNEVRTDSPIGMGVKTNSASGMGMRTNSTTGMGMRTDSATGMGVRTDSATGMGMRTDSSTGVGMRTDSANGMGMTTSPADILSLDELYRSNDPQLERGADRFNSVGRHFGFKSARMLIYEREGPLNRSPPIKSYYRTPIRLPDNSLPVKTHTASPIDLRKTPISSPVNSRKIHVASPIRTPIRSPVNSTRKSSLNFIRTPIRSPTRTPISRTPIRSLTNSARTPISRTPIRSPTNFNRTPIESISRTPIRLPTNSTRTPIKSIRTPIKYIRTPIKVPSSKKPMRLRSLWSSEETVKADPPDLNPSIVHESVSMAAYSLSTPTKEDLNHVF